MAALPGDSARAGVFGPGTITELPRVIGDLGLRRVLLLTGRHSFTASGAAEILHPLRTLCAVETWSNFSPNPTIEDLQAGAGILQSFRPDVIIGIGGGSVLDMAKLLAAFGEGEISDIPGLIRRNLVQPRALNLILAPTTSGSGSEATHFAVVYVDHEKFSVAHPSLVPDFVVLDPSLTESASRYQKATSVIDAIAQAVESCWARGATEQSRLFARAALTDLVPAAPEFLAGSKPAAVATARGSHLAGRAIDVSKTTGAHALAYALTSRYGISHGHAVSTTLGAFARRHAAVSSSGNGLGQELDAIAGIIGAAGPESVGDRLDDMARAIGLELRLSALGVPRADLPRMAGAVNQERLANNPIALSGEDVLELLESCW